MTLFNLFATCYVGIVIGAFFAIYKELENMNLKGWTLVLFSLILAASWPIELLAYAFQKLIEWGAKK